MATRKAAESKTEKPAVASKPKPAAARDSAKAPKPASKAKASPAKPAKKAAAPKPEKLDAPKEKPTKIKLVRDSFTMPEAEYAMLGEVKKECLKAGVAVKKSELLRIGVSLVRKLDVNTLKGMIEALPVLKAGRPKKSK